MMYGIYMLLSKYVAIATVSIINAWSTPSFSIQLATITRCAMHTCIPSADTQARMCYSYVTGHAGIIPAIPWPYYIVRPAVY